MASEEAAKNRAQSLNSGVAARDIGPSGKPKIHQVSHASEKAAKDSARAGGKSAPLKHATPTRGQPHYHATKNDGEKATTRSERGVHHNYPGKGIPKNQSTDKSRRPGK